MTVAKTTNIYQSAGALISPDGLYRYSLTRVWDETLPVLGWVMCNPSTADGNGDDPTIRRIVGFARGWGYGGIVVGNLYGLRATDPRELRRAGVDPVGPNNWSALNRLVAATVGTVVCAWGGNIPDPEHADRVLNYLQARTRLAVLGWTVKHQPRHPLYVRGDAPLIRLADPATTRPNTTTTSTVSTE